MSTKKIYVTGRKAFGYTLSVEKSASMAGFQGLDGATFDRYRDAQDVANAVNAMLKERPNATRAKRKHGDSICRLGMMSTTLRHTMFTEQKAIDSAREQYRICFKRMAFDGMRWHLHKTGSGTALFREDAVFDVPLPIIVSDVQAMTETKMVNALSNALKRTT